VSAHIGDQAALYALGALDDAERNEVDAHVASCDACAALLGIAEDQVTSMVDADAQYALPAASAPVVARARGRLPLPAFAALAAVLIMGFVTSGYFWQQSQTMHAAMVAENEAMSRLAAGPFRTVAFSPMQGAGDARVMYGPTGAWYVVVVRGASKALQVAWMHDGERTMLGTAQQRGGMAMLYLPQSHRMDQLALMDGETVVAEARLAY
jgi:anti-sigma factor RsiW